MQQKLATIYLFIICYVYPLIYHNQYYDLGSTKVRWFVYIQAIFLLISIGADSIQLIIAKGAKQISSKNSKQDILLYVCLFFITLSFAFSKYKSYSFWGAPGWGQGFIPLLLMFWSFYIVSKKYSINEKTCNLLSFSVFLPALIGFLNVCKIDILGMNKGLETWEKFTMLSTIGNPTWYVAYIGVFLPLVFYSFLKEKKRLYKILCGVNLLFCIISVLFSGTDSGIIVLLLLCFYVLLVKKENISKKAFRKCVVLTSTVICGIFVIFLINSLGVLPLTFFQRLPAEYFSYDDAWGNGRGFIWNLSISIFQNFSIKEKIFGIGPDCFACILNQHISNYPEFAGKIQEAYGNALLTNAHNIYVNTVITLGLVGFFSYILFWGHFIKKSISNCRKQYQNKELFGINNIELPILIGIITYFIIGTVGYEQPCATPFLYILGGLIAACHRKDRMQL